MALRLAELPDCPTQEAKVALLFEEFDVRQMGCIDIEGMLVVFNKLNMGCSNATVNDLYERADIDGDGVVNASDFARFAESYPTLVDCLYYRMKDYWYVVDQREEIERAQATLLALSERKDELGRDLEGRQAAAASAADRLEQQSLALQQAQGREADNKRMLDNAHETSERVRCELRDMVYELNTAKDSEKQCVAVLHERQRVLEHSIQRLQNQEAEVVKAQERLRDIERMLAEQQREVERQIQGAERCRAEAEEVEMKEQEAEAKAEVSLQVVHTAADAVTESEAKLATSADAERQAARRLKESADDTARQIVKRDQEQMVLQSAKEEEARKKAEVSAATEAIQEQSYYLEQLVQENSDFSEKRRQVDEEELQLIEQEVQLRRQRATLEKNESKLRSDFTAFAFRQTYRGVDAPRIPDVTQMMQHQALPPITLGEASPRSGYTLSEGDVAAGTADPPPQSQFSAVSQTHSAAAKAPAPLPGSAPQSYVSRVSQVPTAGNIQAQASVHSAVPHASAPHTSVHSAAPVATINASLPHGSVQASVHAAGHVSVSPDLTSTVGTTAVGAKSPPSYTVGTAASMQAQEYSSRHAVAMTHQSAASAHHPLDTPGHTTRAVKATSPDSATAPLESVVTGHPSMLSNTPKSAAPMPSASTFSPPSVQSKTHQVDQFPTPHTTDVSGYSATPQKSVSHWSAKSPPASTMTHGTQQVPAEAHDPTSAPMSVPMTATYASTTAFSSAHHG